MTYKGIQPIFKAGCCLFLLSDAGYHKYLMDVDSYGRESFYRYHLSCVYHNHWEGIKCDDLPLDKLCEYIGRHCSISPEEVLESLVELLL